MYIASLKMKDGDCNVTWLCSTPTVMWSLEYGFWRVINRLPLMDYIDNKYYGGSLDMLGTMDKKIRRKYQPEIKLILEGFRNGAVW